MGGRVTNSICVHLSRRTEKKKTMSYINLESVDAKRECIEQRKQIVGCARLPKSALDIKCVCMRNSCLCANKCSEASVDVLRYYNGTITK